MWDFERVPPRRLSVWRGLKSLIELFDWICFALFLAAVAQLFLAKLNIGILFVFLWPPLIALRRRHAPRRSTRWFAHLFLFLVGVGELAAQIPGLAAHEFKELSAHDSALLHWYVCVYLAFILIFLPPFLFLRPLIDRYYHRPADFSVFTCCLGLFVWVFLHGSSLALLEPYWWLCMRLVAFLAEKFLKLCGTVMFEQADNQLTRSNRVISVTPAY